MRHLYDDIEDIKWILVELYNSVEFIKEKLNGNILFYKLESTYSDSDLNVAKLRLNDLEYEILSIYKDKITIIKSSYFKDKSPEDKSIKSLGLKLLNNNFGSLKSIIKEDKRYYPTIKDDITYYVDKDNLPIFYFYEDKKNGYCYVDNDKVWSLLESNFGTEYSETQSIIRTWLEKTYKLTGLTTPKPDCYVERIYKCIELKNPFKIGPISW